MQFVEELDQRILGLFNVLSALKEDFTSEKFLSYCIEKILESYPIEKMGLVFWETVDQEISLFKIKNSRGLSNNEIKEFHREAPKNEAFINRISKLNAPLLLKRSLIDANHPFHIISFDCCQEGYLALFPLKIEGESKGFLFVLIRNILYEVDILIFNSVLSILALVFRYEQIRERFKRESFYNLNFAHVHNIKFLVHDLKKEISRAKTFDEDLSVIVIEISNYDDILYVKGAIDTRIIVLYIYNFFKKMIQEFDYIAVRNNERQIVIVMPETSAENAFRIVTNYMEKFKNLNVSPRPVINIGIGDLRKGDPNMSPLEKAEVALEEAVRIYDSAIVVFDNPELVWKIEQAR